MTPVMNPVLRTRFFLNINVSVLSGIKHLMRFAPTTKVKICACSSELGHLPQPAYHIPRWAVGVRVKSECSRYMSASDSGRNVVAFGVTKKREEKKPRLDRSFGNLKAAAAGLPIEDH